MIAFRKRAEMFVAYPRLPLLPTRFVDNSMPRRDWSRFDAPAKGRFVSTRAPKTAEAAPLFFQRQAG